MEGLSATQSRELISNVSELEPTPSRQAIENIYLRLGNYLWTHFVKDKMLASFTKEDLDKDTSFDLFVVTYLDTMRKSIEGNIDYKDFRDDGVEIGNMGTTKILVDRSKRFNGLPAKTFHCHFAYASFIDTMQSEIDKGKFTFEDVKTMLLGQLENEPL